MSNLNEDDIAEYLDENPRQYRKKPVVIEAYRTNEEVEIETLEGTMKANVGDFIITGVQGEQYPCKPDIFAETYEEVSDEKTIDDWFSEWNDLIEDINTKSTELYILKEKIFDKEQKIINNTDFKELYGKNNADVRKTHLKQEMQADYDAKNDLEMNIDDAKRKISFIRSMMDMQRALLDAGVIE